MPEPKNPDQPVDIGEVLHELALKIDRVKQLYEQYFMGIEKIEPGVARKEVTRALLLMQQHQIRNTGLRFKFNTMLQKWNIYITYWNRTLREIEAGTYLPHLAKARRAAERQGKELPEELTRKPARLSSSQEVPALPRERPSLLPPPIPGAKPQFPPPAPRGNSVATPLPKPLPQIPGMSESDLRALHKKYVDARVQAGEPSQVSYSALVNSLARQVPQLLAQPGVREVRFDVALQNGKAVLKAFPKK